MPILILLIPALACYLDVAQPFHKDRGYVHTPKRGEYYVPKTIVDPDAGAPVMDLSLQSDGGATGTRLLDAPGR